MTDHPAETILKGHYASPGIKEKIQAGLQALGKTVDTATPGDLKMMDEFHMGGAPAAMHVLQAMRFAKDDTVLDVGCGVGGTTRALAAKFSVAQIEGVDLTPEYIEVGNEINAWPLIKESFKGGVVPRLTQGSALALPYPDASFSKIVMLHVGMNIEDKARLFLEFKRVLKPGGTVGVFDVMRTSEGELPFPMPWSSRAETSFVETPEVYKQSMSQAGFTVLHEENRREAIMDALAKQLAQPAPDGSPPPKNPLTLGILMGESFPQKGQNIGGMTRAGVIAPIFIMSVDAQQVCGG
jgi:ubiquinone/menaquinone biosynthesis C-methylase UbiE